MSAQRQSIPDGLTPRAGRSALTGINLADMRPHLSDGYVIKGLIKPATVVLVFGPPGCGKTTLAADMAMHIAAGRPYLGRKVKRGLVGWAGLEAPTSAKHRFLASRIAGNFEGGIPLRLTPGPINLRDPADVALLIEFMREAETTFGEKAAAIFVDTLARGFGGGDENSSEDMGALIDGADAIKLATGAAIIIVHHMGKDESRGARGHSSLKGAVDTEIEVVAKDSIRVATVTKQRDYPAGDQLAFRLRIVELGRDEDGDSVTSCAVEYVDAPAPVEPKRKLGSNQQAAIAAVAEWARAHESSETITAAELAGLLSAQGIQHRGRKLEVINALVSLGVLTASVGGHRVNRGAL